MDNKIKVQIYGIENQILGGGCSSGGCGGCASKASSDKQCCRSKDEKSGKGCGGACGSSGGCGSKSSKTIMELYKELTEAIMSSDIGEKVELEFIDIRKINVLDNDNIRVLYDMNYELPYCVIDNIVRYYGGISNDLIYKDLKELLNE